MNFNAVRESFDRDYDGILAASTTLMAKDSPSAATGVGWRLRPVPAKPHVSVSISVRSERNQP